MPDGQSDRFVVVPRTPGKLIDPEAAATPRPPDEIDEAIDELFGPEPPGSPSWVDAALLAAGTALVVWAQAIRHSAGFTVLGAVLVVLGAALPLRSLWRWTKAERLRRRRARLDASGVSLNVGSPLTARLAQAYEELLRAATQPGVSIGVESVTAAQSAVLECASLLAGDVPSTPAETDYVEKRVEAIEHLSAALRRQHAAAERAAAAARESEARLERQARTLAGEELESLGVSSLSELRELARLTRGDDDA
jgi:hypothetical protein